jgi:ceramide glucosyltransferase
MSLADFPLESAVAAALALLALVMLALHLLSVGMVWRRLHRPLPEPTPLPAERVTLLRPVRGVDRYEEETLRSSFLQDHPDYEVIFCAQVEGDPAIALVKRLMAEHPAVPARLLVGEAMHLRNLKLRNVWKGWRAATTRHVVMADSNLLLPPDYLSSLERLWAPGVGLVTSPPVGTRPEGWAGHLECAFLNANQARLQLTACELGFGFAQGKTLAYDKPLLDRLGGIERLDRNLAEDVATTRVIRAAGLKVVVAPRPFEQPIGRRRLAQVWDRQLRWAVIRREGFPWLFAIEPLNGALLPLAAAAGACALTGLPLALVAAMALLWYAAEWMLARGAGWPAGWRDALALPLRDLMMPAIWVAAHFQRAFTWHGATVSAETSRGAAGSDFSPQA